MMDPRRITMKRGAFSGQMILVGVGESFVYVNGQRTDEVSAIRCDVVLPAYMGTSTCSSSCRWTPR